MEKNIIEAKYGANDKYIDVTDFVKNNNEFKVCNENFTDPIYGVLKKLIVKYDNNTIDEIIEGDIYIKKSTLKKIYKVLYINLDNRVDRKQHCIKQFKSMGFDNVERISAIKHNNPAIGCTYSHIKALEKAKEENLENVLICEDDVVFTNPELLKTQLNYLFDNDISFDVFMLGVNIIEYKKINQYVCKIIDGQTLVSYIVNKQYYDILLNNFKEGAKLFEKSNYGDSHAIDQYMKKLQKTDTWLCFSKLTVNQLPCFSDIVQRHVNYTSEMLKSLNSNSLYILPRGGFGNILFNVLLGFSLKKKYGFDLYFLTDYVDKRYNIKYYKTFSNLNYITKQNMKNPILHREKQFKYYELNFENNKNYLLDGYFQSYKHFYNDIIECRNLLFKNIPEIYNEMFQKYLKIKNNKETVLIHVRLTDYKNLQNVHPVQSEEYYQNAINNFDSSYNYIIFSDDIELAKTYKVFEQLKHKHFVDETDTEKSFVLMTLCDNFIIANSSFSLSAYYMRFNRNGKIIYPEKWFGPNGPAFDLHDLIPKN